MRAPDFWWHETPTVPALALAPAGAVWGALTARRMSQPGTKLDIPVVCVGNFVAGGAGKTPAAMMIAQLLFKRGWTPAFLTRGYGGTLSRSGTAHQIDPAKHSALEAGDEPLLLSRIAPTFVAANRLLAARAAKAMGATILIMDDGLQNPSLTKSVSLAIVDGQTGQGNGLCIPAGPLRAPLAAQLAMTDAVIVNGAGPAGEKIAGQMTSQGKPSFRATLKAEPEMAASLAGQKVVAFAGIGRPEKFFATLGETGAQIVEAFAFGDHHPLEPGEIKTLQQTASSHDAILITTEKDFVRVEKGFGDDPPMVLPVTLVLDNEPGFIRFLDQKLAK